MYFLDTLVLYVPVAEEELTYTHNAICSYFIIIIEKKKVAYLVLSRISLQIYMKGNHFLQIYHNSVIFLKVCKW